MNTISDFVNSLHDSTRLVSYGTATVLGRTVPAVEVINLYKQRIVWGFFSTDKGKFKGKLSNNAATEDVLFESNTPYISLQEGKRYVRRDRRTVLIRPCSDLHQEEKDAGFCFLGDDGTLYTREGLFLFGKYSPEKRDILSEV